jgi:hypothetical protein
MAVGLLYSLRFLRELLHKHDPNSASVSLVIPGKRERDVRTAGSFNFWKSLRLLMDSII